jgi:hypothetical protein
LPANIRQRKIFADCVNCRLKRVKSAG